MRVPLHPCFILHQRDYRETSKLLEVFSSEHGRISLVARGVRRKSFRDRYLLQIGRKLDIAWSIRGEMGTMTDIEAGYHPFELHSRWLMSVFYINELMLRLLHRHEAHPQLFAAYERTLESLHARENEEHVLRRFELDFLKTLGYGLILDHAVDTGRSVNPECDYYYRINYGPLERDIPGEQLFPVSGATLIGLERGKLETAKTMRQAKQIMRKAINSHLGNKLLLSREMYQAYLGISSAK